MLVPRRKGTGLATRGRDLSHLSHCGAALGRGVVAELQEHERKAGDKDRRKGVGLDGASDVLGPLVLGSCDDLVDVLGVAHDSLSPSAPSPGLWLGYAAGGDLD